MGRKKSTPQQRSVGLTGGPVATGEFLGTLALASDANASASLLPRRAAAGATLVEATAERETTGPGKNDDSSSGQESAPRNRRNGKQEKLVAFAEEGNTEVEAISLPEVEIEVFATTKESNDNAETTITGEQEESKVTILRYNYDPEREDAENVEKAAAPTVDIPLRTFRFRTHPFLRLEVTVPTQNDVNQPASLPELPYQIKTAQGTVALMEFCNSLSQKLGDNGAEGKLQSTLPTKMESIALAVEHGLLRFTIDNPDNTNRQNQKHQQQRQKEQHYEIRLALTDRAFQMCSPIYLQVKNSKASKVYQAAACLHRAFAELFPDAKEFFPLAASPGTQNIAITAKDIYALVDNVQFKRYLSQKKPAQSAVSGDSTETLKIPGLVPTLRPYQEAAVRWMLEREQNNTVTTQYVSEEWELAWVVVHADSESISGISDKQHVTFLPEYTQHTPERIRQRKDLNRFFYCPFTCWLAPTLEAAKAMTLPSTTKGAVLRNTKNTSIPFRGGILADSMGLGKTCELLACILANPDPEQPSAVVDSTRVPVVSSSSSSTSLSSKASTEIISVPNTVLKPQGNEDNESAGDIRSSVLVTPDKDVLRKRRRTNAVQEASTAKRSIHYAISNCGETVKVLVDDLIVSESESQESTDSKEESMDSEEESANLEEIWLDTDERELGVCICGKSIAIFPSQPNNPVVICSRCRDPMHSGCAASASEQRQSLQLSQGVIFRRTFSEEKFECSLISESCCPFCVEESASKTANQGGTSKIRSRATVIVTPPAILNQWEREIKRHSRSADGINHLKVVKYPGIRNLLTHGKRKDGDVSLLHPRVLADADIILMTFDALRHDLGHSDSNPFAKGTGRTSLRKRKRYRVVPSPLSSIAFWRVCLDEAQRIEEPTAGSAQMALKLEARFRWAVSGTPIGRGKLEDLFGLLLFLQITAPFDEKAWFRQCFLASANNSFLGKRLQHLLGQVFWRSTKALETVTTQMGVPPQLEKKYVLKFSSVEKHFYDRQLETTLEIATDISKKKRGKLSRKRKGEKGSLDVLASQLHKLRAACCHPQVGSHGLSKKSRAGDTKGMKVMSMAEVLDRLIDDAKTQCEDALRIVLFHSNPMAAIARLKVEAKNLHKIDVIEESDASLYAQSCKHYQDALDLADENGSPSLVTGIALLSGSCGFRSSQKHVRGGKVLLDWQVQRNIDNNESDPVWANFDFGQPKKMCQIRLRAVGELPKDLKGDGANWKNCFPKDCVLQVSNSAVGGEFVDILQLSLPCPHVGGNTDEDWVVNGGFWIYRSKIWRIVVKTFHGSPSGHDKSPEELVCMMGNYIGIEAELFEPTIGSDSLQRLHTLHNLVISFQELLSSQNLSAQDDDSSPMKISNADISGKILLLEQDINKIEEHHLEYAKSIRKECLRRLQNASFTRERLEDDLFGVSKTKKGKKPLGFWDIRWYEDLIGCVKLSGSPSEQLSLCEKVREALEDSNLSTMPNNFPVFEDLHGLHVALKLRLEDALENVKNGKFSTCIQTILDMPPDPSAGEILENAHCHVCKADWLQTGPKCRHCIAEDKLKAIHLEHQKVEIAVLESINKWLKNSKSGIRNSDTLKGVAKIATKFFEVCEAARKEWAAANNLWRTHLDMLNIMDELNSCKTSMRLVQDGENVDALTEEQKGAVIVPIDICARYHEHAAKQAGALNHLRRQKQTLIFLKNQSEPDDTCSVCLSAFDGERGVLACGHSFHTACIESIKKRSGGSGLISCPLRCTVRSTEYLTASNKRRDDGTQSKREVKGCFGTKVTAIVSDLLAFKDLGEKSIVFSMWEDMLDILEEALHENGIGFVRASSLQRIGEATRTFRSSDCYVLLLNVKNGAEGLNLIEAKHVFMIEPLLNCGLDSQATARCHRIGQTRQTYVHRYLIEDTIEIKVDKYRTMHQKEQLEDSIMDGRKCAIQAGGIDGGFSSKEELMDMLSPV